MNRRAFLACALLTLTTPLAVAAQPARRPYRIGWLHPSSATPRATFRNALKELGYVEGTTFTFEARTAEDRVERLPDLALDLVRSRVDVIVAVAPGAIRAARQATSSIPIV